MIRGHIFLTKKFSQNSKSVNLSKFMLQVIQKSALERKNEKC